LVKCIKCSILNKIFLVLSLKNFKLYFYVVISSFPQKNLIFIKYFLEKKIFIKSPYHKRKKDKNNDTHPLSPATPSHTTKKIIPSKIKKIPPSYLEKQPNFSLVCHPRNKPLA